MTESRRCELCGLSEDEHFPFAGTLVGVVRQQGTFDGKPGPFCPLAATGGDAQ